MGNRRSDPCCLVGPGIATLSPPARRLLQTIEWYTEQNNLAFPEVLSACRTPEAQLAMQGQWDLGNRGGLRVRPVDPQNSSHVADENGLCWAFDLWPSDGDSSAWFALVGAYVRSSEVQRAIPGASWGGAWLPKDEPHFQVEPMRLVTEIRLI